VRETQRLRFPFPGSGEQKVIHSTCKTTLIPEADRHARTQDGANLARLCARVELSGQEVHMLTFSEDRHIECPARKRIAGMQTARSGICHCHQSCSAQARPSSV